MNDLGDLLSDLVSGDTERAEAAALAISEHGESAITELAGLTKSPTVETRWWATRALAGLHQRKAGELLISKLTDAESSVRYCAALALSTRGREAAIPALIDALANRDPLLVRLASDALVAQGADAVEPLISALDTFLMPAKVEATRALALIADPRAISALFKLVDSDSLALEHWVNEGLEKMGVGMRFFQAGE